MSVMPPHSFRITGERFIDGGWAASSGAAWSSRGPLEQQDLWSGNWSTPAEVADAVGSAKNAFAMWRSQSLERRTAICRAFAETVRERKDELALLIALETGKPLWEALAETATVIGKVSAAIDALHARRWTTEEDAGGMRAVTRFHPHGVMVVLGPFNLPAHLPGAHIVPALLAGNTVVFKPSEWTPAVGEWLVRAWQSAGMPPGVLNLIHGQAEAARAAVADERIDGVLFTGSYRAGVSIHKQLAGRPETVLALEMGGNNPLIVHNSSDISRAILPIIESAYITSGQRCTCARRLLLTPESRPDELLAMLKQAVRNIRIGLPLEEPQPFIGPLIRRHAAENILAAQASLISAGAKPLVEGVVSSECPALVSPILLDVTDIPLADEEHFGPMLLVRRCASLSDAVEEAGRTRFGLSLGLVSDIRDDFEFVVRHARAGIVNWNRQTTGASGRLPFGGVGCSGNHAPSGFYAADYCSYPVASLECERADSDKRSPGLENIPLWRR